MKIGFQFLALKKIIGTKVKIRKCLKYINF